MKHSNRWIVVILVMTALMLAACGQEPEETEAEPPAVVATIEGTELKRVTLTERAAQRLGIQTAPVSEEFVMRERMVGGQVEALPEAEANAGTVRVRVPLNASDVANIDRTRPALVVTLDDDDDDNSDDVGTEAFEIKDLDDINDVEDDATDEADTVLHFEVNNTDQKFSPGQRVGVRFAMSGSGEKRVVVPYSAVIYDLQGATWVYVSPEPLVFVREPITIDYVQGDMAILSDGPAVGTEVATVGVAELYGADTGVGK